MSKIVSSTDIGRQRERHHNSMQAEANHSYVTRLKKHLPGGVHFNFRESWNPKDILFNKGQGSRITDIDGNEYLDFFANFGANILGHCHKEYMKTLSDQLSCVSAPPLSNLSLSVCEEICSLLPSAEQIRFSVTGTEAVATAIRLARAYTGKQKILRFTGNYHGHTDNLLGGKPSEGKCPYPVDFENDPRASKGLAQGVREQQSILIPWNNSALLREIIQAHHADIACLITEPISINGGGIEPHASFLSDLRKICDEFQIVLIFDEIITGFRVDLGGVQTLYNVTPDLTTLGKAMGGGAIPVSAIAGKKKILDLLSRNEVVHAGTFNGYHAGLAAVSATLSILQGEDDNIKNVAHNGTIIQDILSDIFAKYDVPLAIQGHPACFYIHVCKEKLSSAEGWTSEIKKHDARIQTLLQDNGILLAPLSRFYPSVTLTNEDQVFFAERAELALNTFSREFHATK